MAATYVLSGVRIPDVALMLAMIIVGYLMVSNVHHPDFKGKGSDPVQPIAVGITVGCGVFCLLMDYRSWPVLIFVLYAVYGISNTIINNIRK